MNNIYSDDKENQPRHQAGLKWSGLRALIVDDSADFHDSIERELTSLGILPTAVSSTQEGITAFRKAAAHDAPYEWIVVAWQLPVISGLEMCDLIRNENAGQRTPKLILTSHDQNADPAVYLADGRIDACLFKPLESTLLIETIRQISSSEQQVPHPTEGIRQLGDHTPRPDIVKRLLQAGCDINDLNLEAGLLHLNRNRALYETILHSFLTHNSEAEQKIRAALDKHDYATAERLAHSLKGIAATIGAEKIQ